MQQNSPSPHVQPQQQQQPQQQPPQQQTGPADGVVNRCREVIWTGLLEWIEKTKPDQAKVTRSVHCEVTDKGKDGEPEIKAENWPQKLIMQMMPKQLIGNIGGNFLKDSKIVVFRPTPCETLDSLIKVLNTGVAGCVHFTANNQPACDIKILILFYTAEKKTFLGFIPNHQQAFVERLRKVIQQKCQQSTVASMQQPNPNGPGMANPHPQPQQVVQAAVQGQRIVRLMMNNNNPGLRHLLQQQQSAPTNQFRPTMGAMQNPNMGGPHVPNRPNTFDDPNFEFM